MKELFTCIRERLLSKERLVLVLVIGSSGSVPRGMGAAMLVGKGPARLWGSIGGGFPEDMAIKESGALLAGTAFKKYLLCPNEAADTGTACGGEISVFFRSLHPEEPGLFELIEKALACISHYKAVWFIMGMNDGSLYGLKYGLLYGSSYGNAVLGIAGEDGLLGSTGSGPNSWPKNGKALLASHPVCHEEGERLWFSVPLVSDSFVYIFGGGRIASELIPLLAHLDFRCVVFEDREEFSKSELFPGVEKTILGDFKKIGKDITLGEKDYVVVDTRGHLWDLEAWAFALESDVAYIGVMGSKTKHELVKKHLEERGFGSEAINANRVHTSMGLDIKSETPAEIALSIAAELVLERARRREVQ